MNPKLICGSTRLLIALNATFAFFTVVLIRVQFSLAMLCMVRTPRTLSRDNSSLLSPNNNSNPIFLLTSNNTPSNSNTIFMLPSNSNVVLDVTWMATNQSTGNVEEEEKEIGDGEDCPELDMAADGDSQEGEFEWSKRVQGMTLSAFFWGYVVTQIPCGWLAGRVGPKRVVLGGMLIANAAHIITPYAASFHPALVVILRIVVGLGHGVMFPSLHTLFSKWAPPLERSRLMAPTYAGGILSSCLAMGLTGVLCDVIGWRAVFYIYGAVSYVWLALWLGCVYDSPSSHPRISPAEREYIQSAIGPSAFTKSARAPWGRICTSGPVWAINVSHFCDNWGNYTILTCAPLYMRDVLRFDIQTNGLLMALPYLAMYVATLMTSQLADCLRSKHLLSTTRVRKAFQVIGFLVPGFLLTSVGFMHCTQRALAVTLLTLAVAFQAFNRSAYSINHVDIAPRFSGILCGISNTWGTVPGMVAPYIAAALTPNGSREEWLYVFALCGAVYVVGAVIYVLLGSGEEQAWARDQSHVLELHVTDSKHVTSEHVTSFKHVTSSEHVTEPVKQANDNEAGEREAFLSEKSDCEKNKYPIVTDIENLKNSENEKG